MKYFSITNLNQVYYIEVLKACFIIGLLRNREGFRSVDKYVFNYRLVSHQPVEILLSSIFIKREVRFINLNAVVY